MTAGLTPAVADETNRAIGFKPSSFARFACINKTAEAPSLIPDALPAVTVPFVKIGFKRFSFFNVVVGRDRKSTRLNSSHVAISYAVFCLTKKKTNMAETTTDNH